MLSTGHLILLQVVGNILASNNLSMSSLIGDLGVRHQLSLKILWSGHPSLRLQTPMTCPGGLQKFHLHITKHI
jgi:hypothetical protein